MLEKSMRRAVRTEKRKVPNVTIALRPLSSGRGTQSARWLGSLLQLGDSWRHTQRRMASDSWFYSLPAGASQ